MKQKPMVSLEDRIQAIRLLATSAGSFVLLVDQCSKFGLVALHPSLTKAFEGLSSAYENASVALNGEHED